MSYIHIYRPVALAQYEEAVLWYRDQSEVAAENLIAEIEHQIKVICSDPFRYRNTYKHFRETSLKKFPYCIVYLVDEDARTVIISSVYHHKRNPKKKYRKLLFIHSVANPANSPD